MKYSILLGLLLSVSVFLASMLVVSVAHAGRESHGIMPMGYACEKISSQGAGLRVDLPMLTGQIQGARLSCGEKEIAPFACEDLSGQISLGSDKVVTVNVTHRASLQWNSFLKKVVIVLSFGSGNFEVLTIAFSLAFYLAIEFYAFVMLAQSLDLM